LTLINKVIDEHDTGKLTLEDYKHLRNILELRRLKNHYSGLYSKYLYIDSDTLRRIVSSSDNVKFKRYSLLDKKTAINEYYDFSK